MFRQTPEAYKFEPPHALRPQRHIMSGAQMRALLMSSVAWSVRRLRPTGPVPYYKPIVLGAAAALAFGFVFDIGPWSAITGRLSAQEVQSGPPSAILDLAEPSEADKSALRYFAREGDVDRLEAELRRLRALYPGWQPPRDLLDPEGEDTELQAIWELFGEGEYDEARQAIEDRRQRDPGWNPPRDLERALELAEAHDQLVEASNNQQWQTVLNVASTNEALLTCADVDALWRVSEAFANTGRPKRAYDAYVYILENCDDPSERASTLQKAALTLDPGEVTQLFSFERTGEAGVGEFEAAKLDIIRGGVARGGEDEQISVPQGWLEDLAANARQGEDLGDSMLIGWYLLRHGNASEATGWFRFALTQGHGSDAAEAYILALRATGERNDNFIAREVAYQWRNQSPALMETYLQSVATVLTADDLGYLSVDDVDQVTVDRYVPIVLAQRDANGAQALGWYSYNSCQFIIAEEWFITSANWVPTEAAIFGLALTRLRLGDMDGFNDVVDEWGPIYESVAALRLGLDAGPDDPVTGSADDPTDEAGLDEVVCDPEERQRLRQRLLSPGSSDVVYLEAGSATSDIRMRAAQVDLSVQRRGGERPDIPRREGLVDVAAPRVPVAPQRMAQATQGAGDSLMRQRAVQRERGGTATVPQARVPATQPAAQAVPQNSLMRQRAITQERGRASSTAVRDDDLRRRTVVRRRVRQGATSSTRGYERVTTDASGTVVVTRLNRIQNALSRRDFRSCLSLSDSAIRNRNLSADEALFRGYCLLELKRPAEASQAFAYAFGRSSYLSPAYSDAAYGESLSHIALNLTNEAAIAATRAPQSRARRTELGIQILTQRALAAYRDKRYTEAILYLDRRDRIAPLQKDLMILRGYAYQGLGRYRDARQLFDAVNRAGPTGDSARAVNGIGGIVFTPAPNRPTF